METSMRRIEDRLGFLLLNDQSNSAAINAYMGLHFLQVLYRNDSTAVKVIDNIAEYINNLEEAG